MSFDERVAQRRKNFKKAVDTEDCRRKREDEAVQLRKQKREEALQKKRNVDPDAQDAMNGKDMSQQQAINEEVAKLRQALDSTQEEVCIAGAMGLRKLLSVEVAPPIQEAIDAGVVPRLVEFLRDRSRQQLQFEAAWVLTNIASGSESQTRCVVEHGALPLFVQLLTASSDEVKEQAVWALGNIAGDSAAFRDLVLQSGGLQPLLAVIRESDKTSMTRNATWTLSNLCRSKPAPHFEWVSPALGSLANLIYSADVEVLTDTCWALSYLSDGPEERITAVIHAGVCRRLVDLLLHVSPHVQTPALRTIGNIVTGDDQQTQVVLQCGCLNNLLKLVDHPKKAIRKETCWTVSNITAGTSAQIQQVIEAGLIPPIVKLLETGEFDIKKEATWIISNAASTGTKEQVGYLVQCGCIPPLCTLLDTNDTKVVQVALDALEHILKAGSELVNSAQCDENPYCSLVEQADGLTKLEGLQVDANDQIYAKAMKVLETYFPTEEDTVDCDVAPGGFGFAPGPPQMGAGGYPAGGFNFG